VCCKAKTLTSANEVVEMAQLELQEGQAADAKNVLEDAFASGVPGKGPEAERQKRLLALASQRAADAPKNLQAAEAEAERDKDGMALVKVGLAYTGLGEYDKGIGLIQQGLARLAKVGVKRRDDANLDLGIAISAPARRGGRRRHSRS
jgi:tetratricopeptide (TPR) repeat protein